MQVRLEPQFYEKLERLARLADCEPEQIAAQIMRGALLDSRTAEGIA